MSTNLCVRHNVLQTTWEGGGRGEEVLGNYLYLQGG